MLSLLLGPPTLLPSSSSRSRQAGFAPLRVADIATQIREYSVTLFMRAVAHNGAKRWSNAEKDYTRAIAMARENPPAQTGTHPSNDRKAPADRE